MRQTPGKRGIWDGLQFTTDPVDKCDFVLMLNNNMKTESRVTCPPKNVWALMQEPYVKGFTDWMVEGHECFSKVYTHHVPSGSSKYRVSPPAIPWHVNRSFDQLVAMNIPAKTKAFSWIVGNARDLPGHLKRLSFLKFIQKNMPQDIDLYGRAVQYIDDKWDALAPYRYSLAIENTRGPDYWTEKLADCFLTWTIPIYYGCTNLEEYFPGEAFIKIDIGEPEKAADIIKSVIQNDDWKKRLPALEKARELVLYRYQLFPHLSELIRPYSVSNGREAVMTTIPPYKKGPKSIVNHLLYEIKMKIMRQAYR